MEMLHSGVISDLIETNPRTREELFTWKRKAAKQFKIPFPQNTQLLQSFKKLLVESRQPSVRSIERLLRVRDVRTLSGVAIITALVKPYACPGQCIYCPTEVRMPKSYIETEPAAQRALRLNFDPYQQMVRRLAVLERNGHPTDKIELIVKGGTWSAYPKSYQRWFIKECYRAASEFRSIDREPEEGGGEGIEYELDIPNAASPYSDVEEINRGDRRLVEDYNKKGAWANGSATCQELLDEEYRNENAHHRIIGLTLETRPDWITPDEVAHLRLLGCTRVELGAQSIDDAVLARIKRGHDVASIVAAMALLRHAGFKVDLHMMPQLPGSTPQSDKNMFQQLFNDPPFRPDMIKIYPCAVVPSAELYQWFKDGCYTPYSDQELIEMLITVKSTIIPRYCRISRLIRDIPSQHIVAGNMVTNLRETVQSIMKERGLTCKCLRCREVGHQRSCQLTTDSCQLFVDEYEASEGKEYFLSVESEDRSIVYAFCRLRIPAVNTARDESCLTSYDKLKAALPEIQDCAFIRELHTYGQMVPIDTMDNDASQHSGFGRQLMTAAEAIVRKQEITSIAVIAGVGVREYYRKLGYKREGTYMIKPLTTDT